jgi:hypothetical protein
MPLINETKGAAMGNNLWKERQVMNYRRANNLCFHCGEPYTPAHAEICTKRPKAQLNAIVVNDLDMHLYEKVLTQLAQEDSLASEFFHLSLNAITITDEGEALRIRALLKNQVMLTLVDSGSSHSFVSSQFLHRIGIEPL